MPQYCNRRLLASAQVQRPEAPRPSRSSITMGRSRSGTGAGLQRLRTVEAPKRKSTRPRKLSQKAAAQQAAAGTSQDAPLVVDSDLELSGASSDDGGESSGDEASSPIEVTSRRRETRRQPAPVKGGGKKKKKRRRGGVYDWSKLSVEIEDDDDVAELAAVAPDTVVLCRDGVADQSEATHVLEIEGQKFSVHAPPEVILALYDRFVELGPEIEAKVQGRVEIKFHGASPHLRASSRGGRGWSLSRFWGRSDVLLDDVCDDDLSQQFSTRRSRAVGCTRRRCASPRSSSSSS